MDDFDVNLDINVRKRLFFGKICPAQKGGDCPECAKANDLFRLSRAETDQGKKKTLEDQGRGLYAKSRIFINAINIKDEDKTFPVHIYAIPPLVYDEIISIIRGAKQLDPNKNVFHPINGHNILITKRGSGILTRYSTQIDQNPSRIPNQKLLGELQEGDRSGLHNLNKIEDYIADNYRHITTLSNDANMLRLLPPFEDQTIYKEVKFHRYSIGSYQRIGAGSEDRPQSQTAPHQSLDGPSFDEHGTQDEFNPAALEDIPDFPSTPSTDPIPTPSSGGGVSATVLDDLKAGIEKIESGAGSMDEAERILERLREFKADAVGNA